MGTPRPVHRIGGQVAYEAVVKAARPHRSGPNRMRWQRRQPGVVAAAGHREMMEALPRLIANAERVHFVGEEAPIPVGRTTAASASGPAALRGRVRWRLECDR
jgi:hypothetical protein